MLCKEQCWRLPGRKTKVFPGHQLAPDFPQHMFQELSIDLEASEADGTTELHAGREPDRRHVRIGPGHCGQLHSGPAGQGDRGRAPHQRTCPCGECVGASACSRCQHGGPSKQQTSYCCCCCCCPAASQPTVPAAQREDSLGVARSAAKSEASTLPLENTDSFTSIAEVLQAPAGYANAHWSVAAADDSGSQRAGHRGQMLAAYGGQMHAAAAYPRPPMLPPVGHRPIRTRLADQGSEALFRIGAGAQRTSSSTSNDPPTPLSLGMRDEETQANQNGRRGTKTCLPWRRPLHVLQGLVHPNVMPP